MKTYQAQFPLALRALNRLGALASGMGVELIGLDRDTLLKRATTAAGSSDFGTEEFIANLDRLLASLSSEGKLTTFGRLIARTDLQRTLQNRLQITALCAEHPEIEAAPVIQPIFVVGPPRTGTTIFHDLLALDPANRVPMAWETAYPMPPPETATYNSDPRIARVDADLARVDQFIPEFKKMHPMGAQRAQECVSITSHEFASMIFNTQFRVPSYEDWVMEADMSAALRQHRRFLQVLQWKAPGQRWALKSPQHIWHMDQLLKEYPDARIVQTHRDPARILVSISSLVATLRGLASDAVDVAEIARGYSAGLELGYRKMIEVREQGLLQDAQVIDLHFRDFVSDQVGTVRRAYQHFGLQLDAVAEQRMRQFLDDNPADKHGKHSYNLEDIGMNENDIRQQFAFYTDYFKVAQEPLKQ
ncbi:sulfotransferase [Halieaceae bacterium IMCC14734]|uniref:Sulfotransferase n=1 Tax=Candidatus Litorirhabdus singularis TaxID=2518993 RepID=A0ABT3TDJ8_9GAMM|nr:sulfotransferase [Candidatus Litorirhabdus singularis]MCX2980378.1 sulfotransferase [Candidatus Litorirhabdus singularis]